MNKTIRNDREISFVCNNCGLTIMNATKKQINCTNCGKKITEIHPIGSRKKEKK